MSMHNIFPQQLYAAAAQEQALLTKGFRESLSAIEHAELTRMVKRLNPNGDPLTCYTEMDQRQAKALAKRLIMNQSNFSMQKVGVTSSIGYNFFDLRGPIQMLFPVNTPISDSMPSEPRVNDGVGTAAHWQANRNPGYVYAGVPEGQRAPVGTPDAISYFAPYKELGYERSITFTAQAAGEGYADNVADEHIRGLMVLRLQREAMMLHGNAGSTGANGFALGTAATPVGVALGSGTSTVTASANVSVAVVYLTAMGNPTNVQYGYGPAPTVASGLVPSSTVTNPGSGATQTINGGMSAISAMSAAVGVTATPKPVTFSVPAGTRGVFGYAWYVNVTDTTLANAKLAAITTVPSFTVVAPPGATQAGNAAGLNSDHSTQATDYDGLFTYAAAAGQWTDMNGASFTSAKDGSVPEIETVLANLFTLFQTGVTDIWGSPDAINNLTKAVKYGGNSGSNGFQFVVQRDQQNNLLGGFVVGGYISRYAVNNPTGAGVIPIRMHPMIPSGTLFFDVNMNPYPTSRSRFSRGMLVQRDFYGIEWPIVTRSWQFGTYIHEVLAHNYPWLCAVLTGIGPFIGT